MQPLYVCLALTVGYFSVLFVGWNYSFPTRTEQTLWRAACVTMMVALFVLLIFAQLGWHRLRLTPSFSRSLCTEKISNQLLRERQSARETDSEQPHAQETE